jgi:hypothetical protein
MAGAMHAVIACRWTWRCISFAPSFFFSKVKPFNKTRQLGSAYFF